jgi:hypothetical protein
MIITVYRDWTQTLSRLCLRIPFVSTLGDYIQEIILKTALV